MRTRLRTMVPAALATLLLAATLTACGTDDPSEEAAEAGASTSSPASAGASEKPSVKAVSTEGPQEPMTSDGLPELGVQYHGTWDHYDAPTRARVLDALAESGATYVRVDISWAMMQPQRGSYDMTWGVPKIDTVLDEIRARDLKVLAMFWLSPEWANGGRSDRNLPNDFGDYTRALRWAAERWGGQVAAWEIWNEPNSDYYIETPDPAEYARFLCRAYPVIRQADRGSPVLFGGMMYADENWLSQAYDAGVKGCFDIFGIHPYMAPSDAPPDLPDTGEIWRLSHMHELRDVMLRNGDDSPVWITEFGWSEYRHSAEEDPWRRGVDEATQAQFAVQMMRLLKREFPYVTKAFWYKEFGKSGDPHHDGYALLRDDFTPRQVYGAFQRLYGG